MGMQAGIVGLGTMGSAIAGRLRAAGHAVTGFDPDPAACAALRECGGSVAGDAAAVAAASEIAIICVASSEAFAEATGGIAAGGRAGLVVADTCTLAEADKRRAADALAQHGIVLLDCAMSGNRRSVQDGSLALYASGDEAAYRRALPVLQAFAGNVRHVGAFGRACRVKFVLNHLVCIHNAAAAEAMAFATRLGLDASEIHEIVRDSAAGSRIWDIRGRMMVARDYRSSRGGFGMARKDGPLIAAAAAVNGYPAPLFDLALALHRRGVEEGYGELDTAALYESCRQASGQDALEPEAC